MRLRLKILLMCLGCTLFALILQTLLFQETSAAIIYNHAKEERMNSMQNMQNEIYGYLKNIESNLIELYGEEEFMHSLKRKDSVDDLRKKFYRKAYEIGTSQFETSDCIVSFYLYTPEHEVISTYRSAVTPKHNYQLDIYKDSAADNAEAVRRYIESEESKMLVSSYFNEYRQKDIIRFVLKLYDNRNFNKIIGYAVCDADSKVIQSIMKKYNADATMFTWLQPSGDRPAVSTGTLDNEKNYCEEIIGKIQSGMKAGESGKKPFKQELFQIEQNKYNLTAYSLMPQELLKQNQKALTVNLILIGSIMITAATILTILVSKSMTKPLENLMETIEKIKEGNTQLRTNIINDDEIGKLGKNFNEMLDRMEELSEKEKQANYLLSQAEYKALQAQINPHFLYNTLDTMSSIAQIKNCQEVSSLSQSLSNIFRYSLNMKDPFSTLSKEIVHLKNYSYVMDMRMQDNVKYIYDIDENTLQENIPRLSLQPLVENALNHGLRNKRGEKLVKIQTKILQGNLIVCVEDNGVGMDTDEINQSLKENDINYVEKGNSIGLHNINARLKMLYGEPYGLRIESVPGEGTKVYMLIPIEKGQK